MSALQLHLDVIGTPIGQGSHIGFVNKANNRVVVTESNKKTHAGWRNALADAARDAWDGRPKLDGPLELSVEFRFAMPASRPAADRKRGWCYKTTAPDTDKLLRSIGDALTAAGVIVDDARFAVVTAIKIETVSEWCGASIDVMTQDYEL